MPTEQAIVNIELRISEGGIERELNSEDIRDFAVQACGGKRSTEKLDVQKSSPHAYAVHGPTGTSCRITLPPVIEIKRGQFATLQGSQGQPHDIYCHIRPETPVKAVYVPVHVLEIEIKGDKSVPKEQWLRALRATAESGGEKQDLCPTDKGHLHVPVAAHAQSTVHLHPATIGNAAACPEHSSLTIVNTPHAPSRIPVQYTVEVQKQEIETVTVTREEAVMETCATPAMTRNIVLTVNVDSTTESVRFLCPPCDLYDADGNEVPSPGFEQPLGGVFILSGLSPGAYAVQYWDEISADMTDCVTVQSLTNTAPPLQELRLKLTAGQPDRQGFVVREGEITNLAPHSYTVEQQHTVTIANELQEAMLQVWDETRTTIIAQQLVTPETTHLWIRTDQPIDRCHVSVRSPQLTRGAVRWGTMRTINLQAGALG